MVLAAGRNGSAAGAALRRKPSSHNDDVHSEGWDGPTARRREVRSQQMPSPRPWKMIRYFHSTVRNPSRPRRTTTTSTPRAGTVHGAPPGGIIPCASCPAGASLWRWGSRGARAHTPGYVGVCDEGTRPRRTTTTSTPRTGIARPPRAAGRYLETGQRFPPPLCSYSSGLKLLQIAHIGALLLGSLFVAYRLYIVYRQSPLGPVDPSFRALSGRLKCTVRRHKLIKILSQGRSGAADALSRNPS